MVDFPIVTLSTYLSLLLVVSMAIIIIITIIIANVLI